MNENQAYSGFDCQRFEEEVFSKAQRDPLGQRLRNIYNWDDVRYDGGIAPIHCDVDELRKGFMSAPLHDYLERKLGKERLGNYFQEVGTRPKPQLSEDDKFIEELADLIVYGRKQPR